MTTQLYIRICKFLREKIKGTQWEGHVFTVGGCCRDLVLGKEIHDVDLAVDLPDGGVGFADWLHAQRLSIGRPVIFARYGTAMLRLRAFPKDDIEIVQTRAEKYTDKNSRNPLTAFGSIKDDCMRRDLTINALYYDITNQKLLDITGRSLADIRNKVIATPMDPDATYDDDPIRILRTARFAARLGWTIPPDVFEAMSRNVHRLDIIKPERLRNEFEKMLLGENAGSALDILRACGVMNEIAPELTPLYTLPSTADAGQSVWSRSLAAIDLLPPDLTLRWAALLSGAGQDAQDKSLIPAKRMEMVMMVLSRLKYHRPLIKDVLFLTANHEVAATWGKRAEYMDDSALRRVQFLCTRPDKFDVLLQLIDAYNRALPAAHAMPFQVEEIRNREELMRSSGTSMYGYHLPFAERRIKKLLHVEAGPLVEDTLDYMMSLAFDNPSRSKSEFERLVSKYEPHEQPEGTSLAAELRPCCKQKRPAKRSKPQPRPQPKNVQAKNTQSKNPLVPKQEKVSGCSKRRRRYSRHRPRKKEGGAS